MRRSHIDNMTWSFHISENGNSSNQWPELDQKDQVKQSARKKESTLREGDEMLTLDDLEYPELGETSIKNRNAIIPKNYCNSNPDIQIVIPVETNMESKQSKNIKRYRRTDPICINLQEILQNTRYMNKIYNKELPKLKIDLCKGNIGVRAPGITDRNKSSDFRKVRICISKAKKPSKLKKIILLDRNMKAQSNVEKREAFERAKMEAICKDVDTINFNALKITSDSERNTNYIRSMCTMTLYGKKYRERNTENISESCVYYRPDLIEQINNLHIQGRQLSNRLVRNSNRIDLPQFDDNIIENDVIKHTLSLELKDDSKQEITSNVKTEDITFVKYCRNFREYCTNMLTKSLNDSLEKFLGEISRFQKRFHQRNPIKSKYKRRYYAGLKEVCKQIELNKVKFVIIAPDIEKIDLEGGLDDQIDKLLDTCRRQNVVYSFGLRRRKLGYYTHGRGLVGCIGIANYGETEVFFKHVLTELVEARNAFKRLNGAPETIIDISKVLPEDYLPSESVNTLLKVLSPLSMYS